MQFVPTASSRYTDNLTVRADTSVNQRTKLLTVVQRSQRVPMTEKVRDGGDGVRPSGASIYTARETKPAWPLLLW